MKENILMTLISYTRLHRKSFLDWPALWWHTILTSWQVVNTPGFLGAKLIIDANGASWTVSAWDSKSAMQKYRTSGAHHVALLRIQEWCDEAAAGHWEQENSNLPNWEQVHHHMTTKGYFTRLTNPAPAHLEHKVKEPVLFLPFKARLYPRIKASKEKDENQ
jgi:hypothetical protein